MYTQLHSTNCIDFFQFLQLVSDVKIRIHAINMKTISTKIINSYIMFILFHILSDVKTCAFPLTFIYVNKLYKYYWTLFGLSKKRFCCTNVLCENHMMDNSIPKATWDYFSIALEMAHMKAHMWDTKSNTAAPCSSMCRGVTKGTKILAKIKRMKYRDQTWKK